MNEKNISKRGKAYTLGRVLGWIFGTVFMLGGLVSLTGKPLSGILMILGALLILPPSMDFIARKWNLHLTRNLRILLALILIFISGSMTGKETINEARNSVKQEATINENKQKEIVQISAMVLTREYEENAIATEDKYKDKILEVSGIIESIDRDILSTAYITLKGANYRSVQCMFPLSEEKSLGVLKKGQSVVVRGEVSGELINVLLKGCKVVQ